MAITVPGDSVSVNAPLPDEVALIPSDLGQQTITTSVGTFQPPSTGINDLSDIGLTTPAYSEISPVQLPIRGEKRIVPQFIDVSILQDEVAIGVSSQGGIPSNTSSEFGLDAFSISASLKPFVDYVIIRIPHRGLTTTGDPDPTTPATFRFLINPSQVSIQKTTIDTQTLTRAGWQFGVWGEDMTHISLSGKTAGQYFALGLTDLFEGYTRSYRNLQQLVMVFENNGYWFEGEEAGTGASAPDYTRRSIKMHQDVELIVGNFIWYGMFDSLEISQDAESPFLVDFNITFIAWKERYRASSPYGNSIANNIQRGHSYGSTFINQAQIAAGVASLPLQSNNNLNPLGVISPLPPNAPINMSPAVQAAAAENQFSTNIAGYDYTPMGPVFDPGGSGIF